MHIFNENVDALAVGDDTVGPLDGTSHVFDVPDDLAAHHLGFAALGWRHAEATDWAEYVPPVEPADEAPTVEPTPVDEPAVAPVEAADEAPEQDAPADDETVEAPAPVDTTDDAPTVDDADGEPATVGDALVKMAADAGDDGLSAADAVAALGKSASNTLSALVTDGRLVRVGRGLYKLP